MKDYNCHNQNVIPFNFVIWCEYNRGYLKLSYGLALQIGMLSVTLCWIDLAFNVARS